jgi:outer membrane lipoprotein LolB
MTLTKLIIIIFTIYFLIACTPQQQLTPEVITAPKSIQSINSWKILGAIAIRNNNKTWTAHINWEQQGINNYIINLIGPLSNGNMMITNDNAKILLKKHNIYLPIHNLFYWIRAIPVPKIKSQIYYSNNHQVIAIKQANYNIQYDHFIIINGILLPKKIHLQGNGITIKLVIKTWQI